MGSLCKLNLLLWCAAKGIKETGGAYEQHYVSSVIELHDKYLKYVVNCFSNSSLFHKALKEAFESFCNKTVAGTSSAELMATFCNNLLKKVHLHYTANLYMAFVPILLQIHWLRERHASSASSTTVLSNAM